MPQEAIARQYPDRLLRQWTLPPYGKGLGLRTAQSSTLSIRNASSPSAFAIPLDDLGRHHESVNHLVNSWCHTGPVFYVHHSWTRPFVCLCVPIWLVQEA